MTDILVEKAKVIPGLKKVCYKVGHWDEQYNFHDTRTIVSAHEADVVSSRLLFPMPADGRNQNQHTPVLDLDIPAWLVASTTEGHWHLYIDAPMSWWRYKRLLKALWKAGVIEKGFYRASLARKASFVRLPWISKEFFS